MVTLPDARSATDLIPGNPVVVAEHATHLRTVAAQADEVGRRLRAVATDEWSGEAADAFRRAFSGEPGRWFAAADSLTDTADALERYSVALATAQGQAESALAMWRLGVLKTRGAQVAWTRQSLTDAPLHTHEVAGSLISQGEFIDPGHMRQVAAHDAMYRARQQLEIEVRLVVGVLRGETDCAPRPESFGARVGRLADTAQREVERVEAVAVNGVASAGNAALHHPLDALSVLAGAELLDAGTGGAAAGALVTATGVGAPVGLPAVAVSAGAIAAGVGLVAVGGRNLVMHATSDDAVRPLAAPATPAPAAPPTRITGWTDHGLAQAAARRVLPQAMDEAVAAPEVPPILQDNGTFKYIGARAVVILNGRGAVVTTWARNAMGMGS